MEELVKSLLEDPVFTAAGGAAVYAAVTYAAGRANSYTRKEAENLLEDGLYDSAGDVLRGLYDKGRQHAAEAEIDLRQEEFEPEEEEYWEDIRSETDPSYGD